MIKRQAEILLLELAKGYPLLAITGPRQSGKTTLAQATFPNKRYVSLEDLDEREFADQDPRGFLARFPDGAILDEIQRCPNLFPYLQTRVDAEKRMGLFVLTGSQQFGLMSNITQTLAGRVGLIQLLPFSLQELQAANEPILSLNDFLCRGMYPPIHDRNLAPEKWFANYVMTYLERDVRQVLEVQSLSLFQRFIKMCAARVGQLINMSSLAIDCGVSHNTIRSWLSVLEAGYVVFMLQPHHQNFGKRLVKTPKLYFYDTGLAAFLLGIRDTEHLSIHSARGSLFENMVVSELLKQRYNQGLTSNLYFWRNNIGDEVDVVIEHGEKLMPIEIKSSQTFSADYLTGINKWMKIAGDAAFTPQLIYGGSENMTRNGIEVRSWKEISQRL